MSLLVGLKESISIPTGIIWFSSAFIALILASYNLEEIQLIIVAGNKFSTDIERLNYLLNELNDSLLQFGTLTILFSAIVYYCTDFILSSYYNLQDKNYNVVRRFKAIKERDRDEKINLIINKSKVNPINRFSNWFDKLFHEKDSLNSREFPMIQNIANNAINNIFLCFGTLLISFMAYKIGSNFLFFTSLSFFVFQAWNSLVYFRGSERHSIPSLRLYYALCSDVECEEGENLLKDAVVRKNWGSLKTKAIKLNSKVLNIYSEFYYEMYSLIFDQNQTTIQYSSLEEAIWENCGLWSEKSSTFKEFEINKINEVGFGYTEGIVNFKVWKATQMTILHGKEYLIKLLHFFSTKNLFPVVMGSMYSNTLSLIESMEDNIHKSDLKQFKPLMEEIIILRKKFLQAFDEIKDFYFHDEVSILGKEVVF